MRSGPGIDYPILSNLQDGMVVSVIGRTPDGSWLKVQAPSGVLGWSGALSDPVRRGQQRASHNEAGASAPVMLLCSLLGSIHSLAFTPVVPPKRHGWHVVDGREPCSTRKGCRYYKREERRWLAGVTGGPAAQGVLVRRGHPGG